MKITIRSFAVAGLAVSMLLPASLGARPTRAIQGAKYVFLFIGDGMSSVQIQSTEAYLAAVNNGSANSSVNLSKADNILNIDRLPVSGIATTYSFDHLITDSGAAGTALACGSKTNNGVLGMDSTLAKKYKSIAQLAKESGRKVGIITSVSLDHATPGSFYASTTDRKAYDSVAVQAAQSGYDFFGGGSWLKPTSANYSTLYTKISTTSLSAILTNEGYTTVNTTDAIRALKTTPISKVIATVPVLESDSAMPYEVDRAADQISLAEMTEIAIGCLTATNDTGFFMMIEGGKVDWACHANDPVGTLSDMVAFDDAVGAAIAFYKLHPTETLIVVTGDHETGGMTIGFAGEGYWSSFEKLGNQKCSYEAFTAKVAAYRTSKAYATPYDAAANNIDSDMKTLLEDNFGYDFDTLADYRKARLEAAFDRTMENKTAATSAVADTTDTGYRQNTGYDTKHTTVTTVDTLNYGGYDAFTMEVSHMMSYDSGIGWTSYSHSAIPVPVMAVGYDDYRFCGRYDNTDVAKKLAAAMRFTVTLPVTK
jgi:alkaline phosphatase